MAQLHMVREHNLGLAAARKIAQAWAREVEGEFDMRCTVEAGGDGDVVRFERSGVSGTLQVTARRFELDARLGLLLGAFRGRIEAEITRHLDEKLADSAGKKGGTGRG
jgi:putative polyhydroxyalkanoate system protein